MDLSLKEKFLIISIEPNTGKVLLSGNHLTYGMAGALIFELKSKGIVDLTDNRLVLKHYRVSTDKVVNRAVKLIRKSRKNRKVNTWIMRFSWRGNSFFREIIRNLLINNILRKERRKFLNIIPYNRYFFLQKDVRSQILFSLQDTLSNFNNNSRPEDLMLLALIHACNLERVLTSDKSEKKILTRRLKELIGKSEAFAELKPVVKKLKMAIASSHAVVAGA